MTRFSLLTNNPLRTFILKLIGPSTSAFQAALIKQLGVWSIALLIVLIGRWLKIIQESESIYAAWGITSGILVATANSFFRESKNREDQSAHGTSHKEIATLRQILTLFREEFGDFKLSVSGMKPLDPSSFKPLGGKDDN